MSKTDFQRGGYGSHLVFRINPILAHFDSEVNTEQVTAQINQRFGKKCRKLIFKMAAVADILDL